MKGATGPTLFYVLSHIWPLNGTMYVSDCSHLPLLQTLFSGAEDWQTKGFLHLVLKESTRKGKDRKTKENTEAQIPAGSISTKPFHAHLSLC